MSEETISTRSGEDRPVLAFGEFTACPKCLGTDLIETFDHHRRSCHACGFEWVVRMPKKEKLVVGVMKE